MSEKPSIKRRDFLKISSASVLSWVSGKLTSKTLSGSSNPIEEAARKVGKLPRRKLGYSGREVSIIIGSGDLDSAPTEAGILCGMNYWHKANRWMKSGTPESILKNRDAHYCQVTVDRVGGSHYTGHFDEEEHYAYVKEALKLTGLGYFDDMQLHYGYHNTEELKKDRAFVRAFERLKKEGLVKHLCLSQHSYAGNSRVPKGQSDAEVLTAVVEDGIFEHAQFIYSYGSEPELDRFMEFASKKGFGTIAMKTARGIGRMKQDQEFMNKLPAGISPHNALARWLTTATMLNAAVIRVRDLDEFVETYSGAGKRLTARDKKAIEMMTAQANRTACRLCSKCQPHCPQQVPITEIFRFERYAMDDNDWNKARTLYAELPRKGDLCANCGTCIQYCPLDFNIPEKIARVHAILG
jgi:predicted aldo/keto reductase-like oxidoreductase